jgi:hypothetical protein
VKTPPLKFPGDLKKKLKKKKAIKATPPKKKSRALLFMLARWHQKKAGVEQEKEKAPQVIFGSTGFSPPNRLPRKKTSPDLRPSALPFASCFLLDDTDTDTDTDWIYF